MAKIPDLRRITIEEFAPEQRETVEKLSIILNHFMEETIAALDNNLDIANLNRDIKDFNVIVDSNGIPKSETLIKTKIKTSIKGLNIIKVSNLSDSSFLVGAPFIEWVVKNSLLKVTHITGLTANKQYNLQIELIG